MSGNPRPVMLMILDGWGINPRREGNAVAQARMPFLDELQNTYPRAQLECSGEAVGLPAGVMGNSEVGHLNLGAGRVVLQDLVRINHAIQNGDFFRNQALAALMAAVRDRQSALHLMGLVSDGGVHSSLDHLLALLQMAARRGLQRVYVHAITDGRDTPPDSAGGYLRRLQERMQQDRLGSIASVCGRFYAMDRDNRWERIQKAHRLYTRGEGTRATDPVQALDAAYARGETDEFIRPLTIGTTDAAPAGILKDDDGMVFFNFRADRAREITRALTDPGFDKFPAESPPRLCGYVCMTRYDEHFSLPVAFPPEPLTDILGAVVSRQGLRQLRIAETEKYAHVTYFFNGGQERPLSLEERCLIASPRTVETYDRQPAMSAREVTAEVLRRVTGGRYDLIVLNFANLDMVGHTGVLAAAIEACEIVDRCAEQVVGAVRSQGGAVLVTADHGNAEQMTDDNGRVHTAHSLNPVPVVLVDDSRRGVTLRSGILADVAPTLLELMGIPLPAAMSGRSLIAAAVEGDGHANT